MKSRKTAVLPGIALAAIHILDDTEFGAEVRRFLIRGGYIRKVSDDKYELIDTLR